MGIKKGSALKEDARAIITETKFSKKNFTDDRLLLVEGPDDMEVIDNYYLYKRAEYKKSFRLIQANSETIEAAFTTTAGKKNALEQYNNLRRNDRNVICLLDRDYDFYLKENHSDSRIKYYDYYELENYLFDDSLLMIALKYVCNYPDSSYYDELVQLLNVIEHSCKPYVLTCFLREVNFRKNILNEKQLKTVLKIIKRGPSSMMQMQDLNIENKLERISGYINKELEQVGLNIELVQKIIEDANYEPNKFINATEPLHLFRYAMKGKMVSRSLEHFFNHIFDQNPHLKELKSKGNLSGITNSLKIDWIPNHSTNFAKLLNLVEEEFINLASSKIQYK
ncbi:hypothetical protein CN335_12550 [Bacillus thuringiensis]|uniref:hypothetical protein n=1 Tax=Bacillus thuringiensis TaxID=1428 RepID=UPI000BF58D0D|nr:hypothetical protein [Bacillus thuringiensis]PFF39002.1 hypothetical protein CN335_12550 [Bacillus thuringiensis]PFT16210.1 hypothetical protein COK83_11530 [Bacillus thuringiensis]HEB2439598.1 hypothetical protein [Bacillus thuringiensis]